MSFTAFSIFSEMLRKISVKAKEAMKNFDSEYYNMFLNYNQDSLCKLYDCMKNIAVYICSLCISMNCFVTIGMLSFLGIVHIIKTNSFIKTLHNSIEQDFLRTRGVAGFTVHMILILSRKHTNATFELSSI